MKILKSILPMILIGILSFIIIFFLHSIGAFSVIESQLYDLRFKIRGPLIGWNSEFSKSRTTEKFIDFNNNNTWDIGEKFDDIGNGFRNNNEEFTDLNGNNISFESA